VDGAHAAGGGDRGGGHIPSLRASRVRLAAAAAALLLGCALAVLPLAGAGRELAAAELLAGISLVALGLSLLEIRLLAVVLVCLTAELLVREHVRHVPSGAALAYGAGLLLVAELVAWAETLRPPALVEPAVVYRRIAGLCALALLAVVAAGVARGAGAVSASDTFLAGVAGAAAVAVLVALWWSLVREAA
jgi:hypothetical protein